MSTYTEVHERKYRTYKSTGDEASISLPRSVERLRCPTCRRKMFTRMNDGLRLRTRILILHDGGGTAKCRHCRCDMSVPIVADEVEAPEFLSRWKSEKGIV